jgi:hypothetical protein
VKSVLEDAWKTSCLKRTVETPQLYHLGKAILERNNVADSNPHKITKLIDALKAWEADVDRSAQAFR